MVNMSPRFGLIILRMSFYLRRVLLILNHEIGTNQKINREVLKESTITTSSKILLWISRNLRRSRSFILILRLQDTYCKLFTKIPHPSMSSEKLLINGFQVRKTNLNYWDVNSQIQKGLKHTTNLTQWRRSNSDPFSETCYDCSVYTTIEIINTSFKLTLWISRISFYLRGILFRTYGIHLFINLDLGFKNSRMERTIHFCFTLIVYKKSIVDFSEDFLIQKLHAKTNRLRINLWMHVSRSSRPVNNN